MFEVEILLIDKYEWTTMKTKLTNIFFSMAVNCHSCSLFHRHLAPCIINYICFLCPWYISFKLAEGVRRERCSEGRDYWGLGEWLISLTNESEGLEIKWGNVSDKQIIVMSGWAGKRRKGVQRKIKSNISKPQELIAWEAIDYSHFCIAVVDRC